MPAANVTSLHAVLTGLASGGPGKITGTKSSGPVGIESIIEYRSALPLYLNVVDWSDTFIVTSITGLDSADLRSSATQNPGEHGETPNDALFGGRTIVLTGKVYAGTIWKLRDMLQGLRGSLINIKTEFPLIFHAIDPANDLMIMCKLADKPSIPDAQTVKNQHVRDFQISFRASNPRFLSQVLQQVLMTTLSSNITFDTDNLPTVESFSLSGGLSTNYNERGRGYSPGSDVLLLRDLQRNMIINPIGDAGAGGALGSVKNNIDWQSSAQTTGDANLTVLPTGGITIPNTGGGGPAYRLAVASGHREADIEFTSHGATNSPPVVAGDKLRITGWIYVESAFSSDVGFGLAVRWWSYTNGGTVFRLLAPTPLTDAGMAITPASGQSLGSGSWYRVDKTITVPQQSGAVAFPSPLFYVAPVPGNNANDIFAGSFRVAEPMMDIDRDSTQGVLYGDGSNQGWQYEGFAKQSIARRVISIANMLRNPRAGTSANGSNTSSAGTGGAFDRISEPDPAKQNNFVGHSTWWKLTSDGVGAPGAAIALPGYPAAKPMWINWEFYKVAEKSTYNLSFYVRAATVPRRVYVVASFVTPAGIVLTNNVAVVVPTQTHGNDGKDAVGQWRRFWADIPVPAGAINMLSAAAFAMDDGTPIPSGEAHEVSAAMLRKGTGPRTYVDGGVSGQARPMPEYSWGSGGIYSAQTLGPTGYRNLLPDSDSNNADSSLATAVASVLSKVAIGGAVDYGQFDRASYDGSGSSLMGLSKQAIVSERTMHALSAYVKTPSIAGPRSAVIDVRWYQDTVSPATLISSDMSGDLILTSGWSEIKMERMTPPDKATIAVMRVLMRNPTFGDVLDVDRTMAFNQPTSDGWFGVKSEFAKQADATKPYGEALRLNNSIYTTPLTFRECQQSVVLNIPSGASVTDDTFHLTLAYVDDDNQIYVTMEDRDQLSIIRRDQGVVTTLANKTLTDQVTGMQYSLRARMSDGVVFAETKQGGDIDDPIPNASPQSALSYVMTLNEIAKYQNTPLPMRFGVQSLGANWTVDEWRYYDLTQPTGWNMYRGLGTVSVKGSKLIPLDPSEKLMTRAGLTYRVADAKISVKQRYEVQPNVNEGNFEGGVAGKILDKDNFIAVTTVGRAAGGGGLTVMSVYKVDGGVVTQLATSEIGSMAPATNCWIRMVIVGNNVTSERWTTDPALGGAAADSITYTLAGADAVKFGAGVKGDFGIYWKHAAPLRSSMDDFHFDVATFDDIAYTIYNRGNFEAQTTISLTGPMTNPRVTNEANGGSFLINGTIPAGETWVLANDGPSKRMYRKSDGANRFQYLDPTSMWILLAPNNVPNNLRLTATALSAGWDMQTTFRHTFM